MILLTCCCSQSPAPACSSSLCNSKSLLSNFIHSIPNRSGRFNMKLEIRTLETMGKRWISYSPVIRSREAGAALVLACTERSSASAVGALRPRRMADVRAAAARRLGLADNVQRRENRKSKRESRASRLGEDAQSGACAATLSSFSLRQLPSVALFLSAGLANLAQCLA